jgi:membrane protein DedA with SNARE-associated domain
MADFLLHHGYAVLFVIGLVAQLGAPVPLTPVLLAAGVLAKEDHLSLAGIIAVSVATSALGHLVWYEAGRRGGTAVLRLLCRISIEPDSCVRRTEDVFAKHGARALVAAPWIPGLAVIAPPLAGMSGMSWKRFLALDALGALLWATVFAVLGFVFGKQLTLAFSIAMQLGSWLALAAGIGLGLWLGWKIAQRHWLLRSLSVPRADPAALAARLDSETPPLIVDLRHEIDLETRPTSLPGAVVVGVDELQQWADGIPRDREIILTCD